MGSTPHTPEPLVVDPPTQAEPLEPAFPAPPVHVQPPIASLLVPRPSHPMITRARAEVFKSYYPIDLTSTALFSALVASSEPRDFKSAVKSPVWLTAI